MWGRGKEEIRIEMEFIALGQSGNYELSSLELGLNLCCLLMGNDELYRQIWM